MADEIADVDQALIDLERFNAPKSPLQAWVDERAVMLNDMRRSDPSDAWVDAMMSSSDDYAQHAGRPAPANLRSMILEAMISAEVFAREAAEQFHLPNNHITTEDP